MVKRQPPQNALIEEDEVRHKMWSKPNTYLTGDEPAHIKAMYGKVWSSLQPLDGRQNSEFVIGYIADVWATLALESAHEDPFWLVGQIVRARVQPMRSAPTQGLVIRRLCSDYIDTIVEAV